MSIHEEREDRDQPEQRNGNDVSSTTTSVGFQVDHSDRSLIYAIRNLRVACVIVARPVLG